MQKYIVLNQQDAACQLLGNLLQCCAPEAQVYTFTHPEAAIAALFQEEINLLFIKIRDWQPSLFLGVPPQRRPLLVFISEAGEKGTELLANDIPLYLKEPYCPRAINRLLLRIRCCNYRAQNNWDFLFIKHNYRFKKIYFSQIQWIEAKTNYITICTDELTITIAYSLNKMMAQLPRNLFYRVNRHLVLPIHSMHDTQKGCWQYAGKKVCLSRKRRKEWENQREGGLVFS